MPIVILLATLLIAVGYFLSRWARTATKKQIKQVIYITLTLFSIIGVIILIFSGRFYHALLWVVIFLLVAFIFNKSGPRGH